MKTAQVYSQCSVSNAAHAEYMCICECLKLIYTYLMNEVSCVSIVRACACVCVCVRRILIEH